MLDEVRTQTERPVHTPVHERVPMSTTKVTEHTLESGSLVKCSQIDLPGTWYFLLHSRTNSLPGSRQNRNRIGTRNIRGARLEGSKRPRQCIRRWVHLTFDNPRWTSSGPCETRKVMVQNTTISGERSLKGLIQLLEVKLDTSCIPKLKNSPPSIQALYV
ncbi:hypothetical protein VUR80DRAFT_3269 [Thermomyces stellatus]